MNETTFQREYVVLKTRVFACTPARHPEHTRAIPDRWRSMWYIGMRTAGIFDFLRSSTFRSSKYGFLARFFILTMFFRLNYKNLPTFEQFLFFIAALKEHIFYIRFVIFIFRLDHVCDYTCTWCTYSFPKCV